MHSSILSWAKLTLLLAVFLVSLSAAAQPVPVKFGEVTPEEVKMKVYEKDTAAAAVVLVDFGDSYFTFVGGEFKLVFQRTLRLKILKKAGYDRANIEIPYLYGNSSAKEFVTRVKATTYNWENGTVVATPLDSKSILDEKKHDHLYVKKLALPAVKEGSLLDITYTVNSDFFMKFNDWTFQESIPTAHSEYRAAIPEYFEYKQYVQGHEPMQVRESKKGNMKHGTATTNEYRWVMKDVPALVSEAYITTVADHVSRIEFELEWIKIPGSRHQQVSGSWGSFTKSLINEENFGGQLGKAGFLKAEVASFASIKDTMERVNTIYNFVKDRIEWNKSTGILASNSLRKTYDSKTGSAADINLLLIALLKEAGVEAWPVVLSTRDNGHIPQHSPLISRFNYVVGSVVVGGKTLLMDATDPMRPLGLLPQNCLNGKGWQVTTGGGEWIPLQTGDKTMEAFSADLHVLPNGTLRGTVRESSSGYAGFNQRRTVKDMGEPKYLEAFTNSQSNFTRKKPVVQNLQELRQPFNLEYEVLNEGGAQAKDIIYLHPMALKTPADNPFKLQERKYPVDFAFAKEEVFMCSFTIPEGYVVEELPKSAVISLPENKGKFTYMLQAQGNKVQVISKVVISNPVFYAQEYAFLKQFYAQILAKQAEQIVLRKKS
ncbi:DUF3857 domain-containing protein [Nibribacter ruber]|uniref:DUF3857 domain-containing protein n=1 Tax=Nibribacter ruber TaxID=2698458 RepID=A0A6P1P098_9BACT|nr:DUF3857 domain-containing protein [Nibribacter ruber]QHL88274.1 DUF3857 domain-containing protein [Nibribacter ruber]